MRVQFQTILNVQCYINWKLQNRELETWEECQFFTMLKGYFIRNGIRFKKINLMDFILNLQRFKLFIKFSYNKMANKVNIQFVHKSRQLSLKILFLRKFLTLNKQLVWHSIDFKVLFAQLTNFRKAILEAMIK